ncbi:hypothetical protein Unana1_03171 [Umbelopsis nana]
MDSNPFRTQSPYGQPEQQFTGNNQYQQPQQFYGAQGNYQPQESQFSAIQQQLGNGSFAGNASYGQQLTGYSTPSTMNMPSSFNSYSGTSVSTPSNPTGLSSLGYTQTMPQPQTYGSSNTPVMTGYSSGGSYQMPLPQTQYGQQNQYGNAQYNAVYPSQGTGNPVGSMGMNTGNMYFQQQQPANPDNFYVPDIGVFSTSNPSTALTQPQKAQRPPPVSDGKVRKVNCPVCNQVIEGDEPAINHHVNNHLDDAANEEYKKKQSQPRLSDAQLAKKLYVDEANSQYRW